MGSSLTTLHNYSSLVVPICDYFLGVLLDSTDVLHVVLTPQKAPEEVVTDGYEGAIIYIVQCGQRRPHSLQPEEVVTDGYEGAILCAVWSEKTPFITLIFRKNFNLS